MKYEELKKIIENNGFCIQDFDDAEEIKYQDLYIYVPDESGYWSTSQFIDPIASKVFATATFVYNKLDKITIYKDLVMDDNATDKIYFDDSNRNKVGHEKITVDFLNELCNTIKTNLQQTKIKLKMNKIEEDFE